MTHPIFETEKARANLWLCLIFGGLIGGLLYLYYVLSAVTGYIQYVPTTTLPYAFWFQVLHIITAGPLILLHSKPMVRLFMITWYTMCIRTAIDLVITFIFIGSVFTHLGNLSTPSFIYMGAVSIALAFFSILVTLHMYPIYEEYERRKHTTPKRS